MNGFHRIVTTFAFAAALGATGFGQGPGQGGCGRGDGPRASCAGGQNGAGAQRGKRQGQGRGQRMGQGQGVGRAGQGRGPGNGPGQGGGRGRGPGGGAGACGAVSLEGARTDIFGRPLAPRAGARAGAGAGAARPGAARPGASTPGGACGGGGCGANRADVVPAKPGVRVQQISDVATPRPVPDAYAERLQAALAVELQARDTYRAAAAATGVQRYANLARAEERHADAMAAALRRLGQTPRLAPHGEVDSPASPAEADRIGRELEEHALQVYAGLIADCPDPELARVLGNIQSANLRHRDAVGR